MPKGKTLTPAQVAEVRRRRDAGETVVAIAASVGVSTHTVTRYTAPRADAADPASARTRILRAVATDGPFASIADFPNALRDVDGHRITHLLYDLAKAGLVKFRETKIGDRIRLVAITATDRGYEAAGLPARPVAAEVGHTNRAPSLHPGDGTDFRNQPAVAPGGPITRTHVAPAVAAVPPPEAKPRYPVTRALFDRRRKIEEAARLLDSAGIGDLALTVLMAADTFTPLELEAMAMLTRLEFE